MFLKLDISSFPKKLLIKKDDFSFENIKLKKDFYVLLEYHKQDKIYIIDSPELGIYTYGKTKEESLNDFKIALEDSYYDLKEDKNILSSHLLKQWGKLKEIIEEK